VQVRLETRGQKRRQWLRVLLRTILVFAGIIPALIQTAPKGTPSAAVQLPPLLRQWDPAAKIPALEALKALKRGVDHYDNERYASALEALPGEPDAGEAGIEDYVILFRAKSNLMMESPEKALEDFRVLENRYPGSAVSGEALEGQCQALLHLKDPQSVLAILDSRRSGADAATIYYRARALDELGKKDQSIRLYLQIYSGFPTSDYSPLAERYLLALSPGELKGGRNYNHRLRRAENLLKAGDIEGARALLAALGRVSAPDSESSQKSILIRAEAEYRLGRTSTALTYLRKVKDTNPALHSKAVYLEGACCRRLGRERAFLELRDKALKLYPDSPDTAELCFSVASYFVVNYRSSEAREAYAVYYDAFPKGQRADDALWKLSLYAYFQEQYGEAALGFWKYLLSYPDPLTAGPAMYWMGRCYEKLGDPQKARYFYRRARELANDSYYGQRALEAEKSIEKPVRNSSKSAPGLDFQEVRTTCDRIQFAAVSIPEPDEDGARVMERARRLAAVELGDLALCELRWGKRRYPEIAVALSYIISKVYANQGDYYESIANLRSTFPDYISRPSDSLPGEIWHLLFPVHYSDTISVQAAENKLMQSLILGMIRQESAFEKEAHSRAGARGLMQILPSTGRMLARQAKLSRYNSRKLFQPETNIMLGTRHLASLLQQYGKTEIALAAYNAGKTRVDLWLQKYSSLDMAEFVEQIPFSETRSYVRQVMSNKAHYDRRNASALPASRSGE
jgi:soluble lytic murein transglycosylase